MKRTATAILCIAMFVIACEKQELNSPESTSAATKGNKQELTITTQPPPNHYFTPTVNFYSNGESIDDGDVIFDNCDYMNLKPSSGKVKVREHGLGPEYLIKINEKRSGAKAKAVGEPYYWISYGDDEQALRYTAAYLATVDTTYFHYKKIGPFTDSTITGTGSWTISFSSNTLIKNGNGTLIYGTSITYEYGGYLDGSETITLRDIGKLIRSASTLTGTYKVK